MKSAITKSNNISDPGHSKSFFAKKGESHFSPNSNKVEKPFFSFLSAPFIQPKLTIGQPGDIFEREADQMADAIVENKGPYSQSATLQHIPHQVNRLVIQKLSSIQSPSLQDVTYTEQEEEGVAVQPLKGISATSSPLISKKQLDNSGSGNNLNSNTRTFMESEFGVDFTNVRIHDNNESARLSESIGARAFTFGKDIYFNKNEYQPYTKEGNRVLAHELTHVVQQGSANKSESHGFTPANSMGTVGTKIQRIGGLGNQLRTGVVPWPTPHPIGTNYEVQTDAGSTVTAWVAYSPYTNALRFWCHGHSLGTYNYSPYGFSVYSGNDFRQVITDEWHNIAPDQTQAGDIAVWTSGFDHSAKFVTPSIVNGTLDPATSMLSSKNGQNPLATMSLNSIIAIYGAAGIAVFRHN